MTVLPSNTMLFNYRCQPRYLEIDQQGVVFHMWYLAYCDDALTAFFAHVGYSYERMHEDGVDVQLVHAEVDWFQGLRWGQEADIRIEIAKIGNTSFSLTYTIVYQQTKLVVVTIVYVCVHKDGSGKMAIPNEFRTCLIAYGNFQSTTQPKT
jgi:acyl-CoA thioester hydrolase